MRDVKILGNSKSLLSLHSAIFCVSRNIVYFKWIKLKILSVRPKTWWFFTWNHFCELGMWGEIQAWVRYHSWNSGISCRHCQCWRVVWGLVSKPHPSIFLYLSFFSWKEKLFLLELTRGKFSLCVLPSFWLTALLCFCEAEWSIKKKTYLCPSSGSDMILLTSVTCSIYFALPASWRSGFIYSLLKGSRAICKLKLF